MAKNFVVSILINAKNLTTDAFNAFSRGFEQALGIPTSFADAWNLLGGAIGGVVRQLPQMILNLAELGIQSQTARNRFEAFAGGTERADMFLRAFNRGALNTVDQMTAMSKSSKLLQMGLVTNTSEMSLMARMATQLGNQTMDAGSRIDDFSLLLANQAVLRLDNFGISSGRVRERIKELLASGQALNREQAFKMAVMEEGSIALAKLGDTSGEATVKIDQTKAALATMRQELGLYIAEQLTATIKTDKFVEVTEELPKKLREIGVQYKANASHYQAYNAFLEEQAIESENVKQVTARLQEELFVLRTAMDEAAEGAEILRLAQVHAASATEKATFGWQVAIPAVSEFDRQVSLLASAMEDLTEAEIEAAVTTANTELELRKKSEADREASQAAGEHSSALEILVAEEARVVEETKQLREETALLAQEIDEFLLTSAMGFTSFFRRTKKTEEAFASDRADIEEEHQRRIAALAKKGQAKQIQINVEAEQKKLETLSNRLAIALLQQSEFGDKTRESTRLAKEQQIAELTTQIGAQEKLLDDHFNNRLWQQGQNITAEQVAEQTRYENELASLKTAREQQEEEQLRSLGKMLLQQFTAWAEIRGLTFNEALLLRTGIAKQYGLITDEGAKAVTTAQTQWELWVTTLRTTADETVNQTNTMKDALQETGDEAVQQAQRMTDALTSMGQAPPPTPAPFAPHVPGQGGGFQSGTSFFRGGAAVFGERGPEIGIAPRGTQIIPADQSRHLMQTFNMNVSTLATAGEMADFETRRALVGQ